MTSLPSLRQAVVEARGRTAASLIGSDVVVTDAVREERAALGDLVAALEKRIAENDSPAVPSPAPPDVRAGQRDHGSGDYPPPQGSHQRYTDKSSVSPENSTEEPMLNRPEKEGGEAEKRDREATHQQLLAAGFDDPQIAALMSMYHTLYRSPAEAKPAPSEAALRAIFEKPEVDEDFCYYCHKPLPSSEDKAINDWWTSACPRVNYYRWMCPECGKAKPASETKPDERELRAVVNDILATMSTDLDRAEPPEIARTKALNHILALAPKQEPVGWNQAFNEGVEAAAISYQNWLDSDVDDFGPDEIRTLKRPEPAPGEGKR